MALGSNTSLVVLSPHHDDAALSLGLTLLDAAESGAALHILNVFTVSGHSPQRKAEGIPAISALRTEEDADFVSRLPGAVSGDLGRRDAPLRGYKGYSFIKRRAFDADERGEVLDLALQLRLWLGHDVYYVPLALGAHIDHRVARAAAERAWAGAEIRYYEDLPYAAWKPELLAELLSDLGDEVQAGLGGTARRAEEKKALIACYASQLSDGERESVLKHFRHKGGERWWSRG